MCAHLHSDWHLTDQFFFWPPLKQEHFTVGCICWIAFVLNSQTAWLSCLDNNSLLPCATIERLSCTDSPMEPSSKQAPRHDQLDHPLASWDLHPSCHTFLHKLEIFCTRLSPCRAWSLQQWCIWELSELRSAEKHRWRAEKTALRAAERLDTRTGQRLATGVVCPDCVANSGMVRSPIDASIGRTTIAQRTQGGHAIQAQVWHGLGPNRARTGTCQS